MILFTKEPYSQDALHGRSAILRCEVADPAGMEFEWLQNGLPIQDTERRFMEGSNLQFTAIDWQQDAGDFQCVARNAFTGEEARTVNASFNIKCEYHSRASLLVGLVLASDVLVFTDSHTMSHFPALANKEIVFTGEPISPRECQVHSLIFQCHPD